MIILIIAKTLKDLIIINRLLKIEITVLIPVFLSKEDQVKVKEAVIKLDKPKVKLSEWVAVNSCCTPNSNCC